MSLDEEYRLLVEAYYGVCEMDEYDLKEYVLNDIKNMIDNFINEYKLDSLKEQNIFIKEDTPIKTKLQSSLIILNKDDKYIELTLLIKKKLKSLK